MSRERIGAVAEKLLGYFENHTTFQTAKMMTAPAASYAEANQWEAETDLIFKRLPLMLALSCEMPNPGDYKAMDAVGLPVLVARDKAGTVHAFLNVCSHRWAPVAAEGRGNCSRFTCPFHGWTYTLDGKLIGIAERGKFGDLDRSNHALKELPCEERHGMIFACLTPGMPLDLASQFGALLDEYADFGLKEWKFLGSSELEGPNWKLIWTNFFENYHVATQHPKTLAPEFISNLRHYEGFGPNLRIGFSLRSIAKLREYPRTQWAQYEGLHFIMRYLFPGVVGTMSLHGISLFTQIFPGPTPDKSRVVLLYLHKASPTDDLDRAKLESEVQHTIRQANDILRDEDFATGFATQKGLASNALGGLLYGRNERGPQYFHEWVDWYLQGDPGLPRPVL